MRTGKYICMRKGSRYKLKKEQNTTERIQYLVSQLNEASKSYYQLDKEIMSNFEYDALYDELLELEAKTGIVLANSPTQNHNSFFDLTSL